jgi:glyoxylase-like metal-dependent hydrolase (beta-lactamase superfamily II)
MMFSYRFVRRLLLGIVFVFAGGAFAAAPQVKTQAPGYYRVMLGDFEVTVLSDGTLSLPVSQLFGNVTPDQVKKTLGDVFLKEPVETSVNAFLVNTGSKLVLIDTGTGGLFGPTLGFLVDNLKAAGYQPEQVDEIYITHLHGDHFGGLMKGDKMVFPNAVVRADQHDADHWSSKANLDAAPEEMKGAFRSVMKTIGAYTAAGKFKPFNGDTQFVPGIKAVATYGHTPGHTIYVVESGGQKLVLWGDLMHVASVQFPDPSAFVKFDTDTKAATAAREKAFADAAANGYWVGAAHLSFPGIGHLRSNASGIGYIFVPINYSSLR